MTAWSKRQVAALAVGVALLAGGGSVLGVTLSAQEHAPLPGPAQAGAIPAPSSSAPGAASPTGKAPAARAAATAGPGSFVSVAPPPVSISIPAIGVASKLLYVGLNADGTIQVPPLNDPPLTNEAAWYKYSAVPGQVGPSVIEGHVDSAADGPSVFFRLGALRPGDLVNVTLADHRVAAFTVTAVRSYPKAQFPTSAVYGFTDYPSLRLITCGGSFDTASGHYTSNVVAFATLVSSHRT